MQSITFFGFVAGTLTTLSFLPQVHKAWRTKRCDDLSMGMLLSFGAGVCLWLVYGLILRASPGLCWRSTVARFAFSCLIRDKSSGLA